MAAPIHDSEADTSEAIARALVAAQCPQWAGLPMSYLATSGTDNAMWQIHRSHDADLVLRLPRTDGAARRLRSELAVLPRLVNRFSFSVPIVRHHGTPTDTFPHSWAVLEWIDGTDAWTARHDLLDPHDDNLAIELALAVQAIGAVTDVDAPARSVGDRGGPLRPVIESLEWWLDEERWSASRFIDVAAVRASAAESLEVADTAIETRLVHGDLIPGNIVVRGRHLAAVIDWGAAGIGDPAQDLAPAWAMFGHRARQVFFDAVGADADARLRARAFELQQAVGGVLYYTPRRHPLADVMARSLHRILTDE